MPRQDVPYGGSICRLKERIAEIFDKLGEKLHTINGVPGDGDGNVKIVSGSSAVVISNDPTQNEIAVSLDTSQLPAASVASVNGQTGAVALDAGDIPTVGGDVQSDIQDLANDISGNTAAINAEALARQNADSALQTNINNVSASLPSAAAAAVAADPTVAYISSELANKVDLSDVSTVETPDTIAKRNGSGRLVAADPASGATDKTLVTANWVSQTGSGAPNNLLHKNGNETFTGIKTSEGLFKTPLISDWFSISFGATNFVRICGLPSNTNFNIEIEAMGYSGLLHIHAFKDGSQITGFSTWSDTDNATPPIAFMILNSTTNLLELWIYRTVGRFYFYPKKILFWNTSQNITAITLYGIGSNTDPYGSSDYQTGGTNNPKLNIPVRILAGNIINT